MRKNFLLSALIVSFLITLSSCDLIGGVFKAGMWFALIIVVAIVALVLWLIGKARK